MKLMKLFLTLVITFSAVLTPVFAAGEMSIDKDNGIYHIILKGEKIKKKIKFVTSEDLITNREAHQKAKATLTVNGSLIRKTVKQYLMLLQTESRQLIRCLTIRFF